MCIFIPGPSIHPADPGRPRSHSQLEHFAPGYQSGVFGFVGIPDFAIRRLRFELSVFISPTQPDNILMVYPPRDEIKICDFGFCQEIDTSRHQYSMLGTPEFVAPEIVHLEPVTVATDIWWVSLTLLHQIVLKCRLLHLCWILLLSLTCIAHHLIRSVGVISYIWYVPGLH